MKFFKITFLLLSPFFVNGQISLESYHQKELFLGIRNSFKIHGTFNTNTIKIHSSNGTIEVDSCFLRVYPEKAESLVLSFYEIQGNDSSLIFSKKYWVKKLPDPVPTIFFKTKMKLSMNALLMGRIRLDLPSPPMVCTSGLHFPVLNYKVLILRDTKFVAYCFNNGSENTKETKAVLKQAQSGDRVLFFDIEGMNALEKFVSSERVEIEVN